MKKTMGAIRLWALWALLLSAIGCRTNLLPEYAGRITGAHSEVRVATVGTVSVQTSAGASDSKKSAVEPVVSAAVGVAAYGVALTAQRNLQEAMPPDRVRRVIAREIAAWAPTVGFPFVALTEAASTLLVVEVQAYGIEAAGDQSPAVARFRMYGALTFLPENKLIWEYNVWLDIPFAGVHMASAQSPIVGDVSNMVAIASLSSRDLRRIFSIATRTATQQFMNQLADDYRNARAEHEAKHGPMKKPAPPAAPPPEADDL